MKVRLCKRAIFEMNEERYSKIESNSFINMIGNSPLNEETDVNADVICYNSIIDCMKDKEFIKENIDLEKEVFISDKGNIFIYLLKKEKDGTTDTKENN